MEKWGCSMEIDITKIPVYWITIETATDRHERMQQIFQKFNFKNTIQINGELVEKNEKTFMQIQQEKSHLVAEAHSKALLNSGPILILEDDVWYTENFNPIVNVPDDTDAVYLGTSIWGMKDGISQGGGTRFRPINEDFVKPYGMLGVHSILYLSESYKKKTIDLMLSAKENGMFMDEPIAINMENENILCYSYPRFYQKDGHNDRVTSIPLVIQ